MASFSQTQHLGLHQSLVMTPQLQQAIKLLQLSRLELADAIQAELTENPVLEEAHEGPDKQEAQDARIAEATLETSAPQQEKATLTGDEQRAVEAFDWENYFESNRFALPPSAAGEELPSYEATMVKPTSLQDHLMWQLSVCELLENDRRLAERLIGEIDEHGYLPADIIDTVAAELVAEQAGGDLALALQQVSTILGVVQNFDPVGVGSRDLKECLTTQAVVLGHTNDLVIEIIRDHLALIEKRQLPAIAKATKRDIEEVVVAVKIIEQMEPRPGRLYTDQEPQYITPDIYVHRNGDDFQVVLNDDGLPRLRISRYYKEAMSQQKGDTKNYIQDKLRNALWLIKSIHQRQRTIFKVMESILKFQRPFFENGVAHLRPLILRQVADDIGMHESTVSRVTTNKYVHTPQGIFELKYFFNSSIASSDGTEDVASEAVKNMIKGLLAAEDPKKPLSDQRLAELINEKHHIDVARRTVAKYREMMGILSSAKRRSPY